MQLAQGRQHNMHLYAGGADHFQMHVFLWSAMISNLYLNP